jgi:hypothetical protein
MQHQSPSVDIPARRTSGGTLPSEALCGVALQPPDRVQINNPEVQKLLFNNVGAKGAKIDEPIMAVAFAIAANAKTGQLCTCTGTYMISFSIHQLPYY